MIEITEEVSFQAAEIRRKSKIAGRSVLKGPDAIIAATAKIHNLILVSNNDRDFIWASKNFSFQYMNPIQDKQAYSAFVRAFEENKKRSNL